MSFKDEINLAYKPRKELNFIPITIEIIKNDILDSSRRGYKHLQRFSNISNDENVENIINFLRNENIECRKEIRTIKFEETEQKLIKLEVWW